MHYILSLIMLTLCCLWFSPTADPTTNPTVQTDDGYVLIAQHQNASKSLFNVTVSSTGVENADDPDSNTYCIIGSINSSTYLFDDGYYWLKLIYRYSDGTNDTLE